MSEPITSPSFVAPPEIGEIGGRPVVLHYGDIAGEYAALRSAALLVDRSTRTRLRFEGKQAAQMLTGLVTNDVLALAPGQGLYAAALSAKGKIISDLRILLHDDHVLVDSPPRASEGWLAVVRKFINPRVAPYRDVSENLRDLAVVGPHARRMLSTLTGVPADELGAMAPYAHLPVHAGATAAVLARVPDAGVEGFELLVPPPFHTEIAQRLSAMGATAGGLLAWEIARIEAGRPEWGLDMDESTMVQEAALEALHAVSYTKGCYTGQEVVARVHFRGHVNRALQGLLVVEGQIPPRGAALTDEGDHNVGDVRSGTRSPRLGPIALAMVRREAEPGSMLTARWGDGEGVERGASRVQVVRLPFPA